MGFHTLNKQDALQKIAELEEYIEELEEEQPKVETYCYDKGWSTPGWGVGDVTQGVQLFDCPVVDALGSDNYKYDHWVYNEMLFRVPVDQ